MTGYDTLRSYDEAAYLRRRRTGAIDGVADQAACYRGSLFFNEIQVRLKGHRVPVLLSMAARYIYARLCDVSSGLIKTFIPYQYVRGRYHGKVEGKYRVWDMRLRAGGHEGIVEQLRRRVWEYERQRLDLLLTRWDAERSSCVYVVKEMDTPSTPHFVFSEKEALCRVRFRSFAEDCRGLMRSSCELEGAVRKETRLLAQYIEAELSDIREHRPGVIPIRGRYRTIA